MIGLVLGIIFATIGAVLLVIGVIMYFKKKAKVSGWLETTGKIVDVKYKTKDINYNNLTAEICCPVVEFKGNEDSVSHANGIYLSRRSMNYKVGDSVVVIYNPTDNYEYYIKSYKGSIYQKEYTFISSGIALIFVGLLSAVVFDNISMRQNIVMRRVLLLLAPILMGLAIKYGNTPKE